MHYGTIILITHCMLLLLIAYNTMHMHNYALWHNNIGYPLHTIRFTHRVAEKKV